MVVFRRRGSGLTISRQTLLRLEHPAQTATSASFQALVVPSTTELIPTTSQAVIVTTPTTQKVKWLPSTTKVICGPTLQYVGQYVAVEGTIVFTKNSAGTIFLDFHMPYQGYFYAVIFSSASSIPFLAVDLYLNKEVRITGNVPALQGKP